MWHSLISFLIVVCWPQSMGQGNMWGVRGGFRSYYCSLWRNRSLGLFGGKYTATTRSSELFLNAWDSVCLFLCLFVCVCVCVCVCTYTMCQERTLWMFYTCDVWTFDQERTRSRSSVGFSIRFGLVILQNPGIDHKIRGVAWVRSWHWNYFSNHFILFIYLY